MAAAGDGDIGEAEAAGAKSRRTIHDYLGEGEDGEAPYPETPPRLRLPRFTCARIRFGALGGRKRGGSRGRKEAAEKSEEGASSSAASSSGAAVGSAGSVAAAAQTGMGLSMLLLLARTCVELNRMAEVRAQMEALLKEIKDEAGRVKGVSADHAPVAPKTCNSNLQSSSSSSSSCVSDTSATCLEIGRGEDGKRTSEKDEGCAGTDALGAELEAEPAPCQPPSPVWKCDSERETPECSMQSLSDDDEFIELEGGRFGGGGGGGGGSGGGNPDDDSDDDDGSSSSRERDEGGVSAIELERRLHELRHLRDRERIAALESALRRAEQRLTEKEVEARLWQDTAALALGRPAAQRHDGRQGQ